LALYQDQFSERFDLPRIASPEKSLIIASTGRSGSHMLGHALQTSNHFGFPLEYTNPINFKEWQKRLGIADFCDVINEIKKKRTSSNGVFGIKIHYPHIKMYSGFTGITKLFPDAYYVLLSRKDVLKQAVSLAIARQTGVWIAGEKSKCDNPIYDWNQIDACLRETIMHNASWRYILAANKCNYIEMNFDEIKTNLPKAIGDIAKFMQIEISSDALPKQQVTKRQSSEINIEWEKRYLNHYQGAELITAPKMNSGFLHKVKRKLNRIVP
jgi:LPS sulfotransferase NodH